MSAHERSTEAVESRWLRRRTWQAMIWRERDRPELPEPAVLRMWIASQRLSHALRNGLLPLVRLLVRAVNRLGPPWHSRPGPGG